jgi:hypothetical protein
VYRQAGGIKNVNRVSAGLKRRDDPIVKRFILCTLGVFLLATALTSGVIAYAQAHNSGSNLLQDSGFEVCDGLPCYMGVMQGMEWKKALIAWEAHGGTSDGELRNNDVLAYIGPDQESKTVLGLELLFMARPKRQPPRLGSIIVQYGSPCGILFRGTIFVVFYPKIMFNFHVKNMRITTQETATSSFFPATDNCSVKGIRRWLGFTTIDHYPHDIDW